DASPDLREDPGRHLDADQAADGLLQNKAATVQLEKKDDSTIVKPKSHSTLQEVLELHMDKGETSINEQNVDAKNKHEEHGLDLADKNSE
ncbi:unnamed protein product, partial [Amoebophrya sp. A120]